MNRSRLSRVDIQVSILTAVIVIISCTLTFALNFSHSHRDMIESLQDRVRSIYSYLDDKLVKESFRVIDRPEDRDKPQYEEAKALLESTRNAAGVRYLYTAKRAADGTFIYLVDGLPSDSGDFRSPGDLIEEEIIADMERALAGETVLPDTIKSTSWGYIFISYMPIHDGDEVVGVVGIEFDADHQYRTYRRLKLLTPLVILLSCVLASATAVVLFKRISNPTYKALASTDFLTGIKNRNAFETDMGNLNRRGERERIGFLTMDLDDLKGVNDTLGHSAGDEYITEGCLAVRSVVRSTDVIYRTGGDEFVAVFRGASEEQMRAVTERLARALEGRAVQGRPVSMSAGYAIYDPQTDASLFETLKRSDRAMYEEKRRRKQQRGDAL